MNIPNIILIALVFNLLDVITGITVALKEHDIKSTKLRNGMFKKIGFIICYFLAWLVDVYGFEIGFNLKVSILPIIIFYTVTTEIVSIIENVAKLNPAIIPSKALKFFDIEPHKPEKPLPEKPETGQPEKEVK